MSRNEYETGRFTVGPDFLYCFGVLSVLFPQAVDNLWTVPDQELGKTCGFLGITCGRKRKVKLPLYIDARVYSSCGRVEPPY